MHDDLNLANKITADVPEISIKFARVKNGNGLGTVTIKKQVNSFLYGNL